MKEQYVSPAILFESFALSQTIARNCGDTHNSTLGESTHYNESTCAWDLGDYFLFLAGNSACTDETFDSIDEVDALCYNNPDGGTDVFSST